MNPRIEFDRSMLWATMRLYEIGEKMSVISRRVGVSEPVLAKKLIELGYALPGRGGRHPSPFRRRGLSWAHGDAGDAGCDPLDLVVVDDEL